MMKKSVKKVLSLMLCLVMLLGVLPTMALAEETLDKVEISGISVPVVGVSNITSGITCAEHDGTVSKVDGSLYYWSARKNSTEQWSNVYIDEGSTESVDNSPFRAGYEYRLSLKLSPSVTSGSYTYTENTTVVLSEVNSSDYTSERSFDRTNITVHFYFKEAKEKGAFSFDISKTVEKGGSVAPGAQTFTFELVDENGKTPADYNIDMSDLKVTTNGVGTFTETITGKFDVNDHYANASEVIIHNFTIREKNEGVAGWTYADEIYLVTISYNPVTGLALAGIDIYGTDAHVNAARFTNTYTANAAPVRDTVTIEIGNNEKPVEEDNPDTGAPVFVGAIVGALAAAK